MAHGYLIGQGAQKVDPIEGLLHLEPVPLPDLHVQHLAHLLARGHLHQLAGVTQADLADQTVNQGARNLREPLDRGGVLDDRVGYIKGILGPVDQAGQLGLEGQGRVFSVSHGLGHNDPVGAGLSIIREKG